jgi:hypothetical protein
MYLTLEDADKSRMLHTKDILTISMWVAFDVLGTIHYLYQDYGAGGGIQIALYSTDYLTVNVSNSSGTSAVTFPEYVFSDNDFHHVVVSHDISTKITSATIDNGDAIQKTHTKILEWDSGSSVVVGGSSSYKLQGKLDELSVYDRELTEYEIGYLYNSGSGGQSIESSSLVLFTGEIGPWELEEGTIEITLTNMFAQWDQATISVYSPSCRWKKFKGADEDSPCFYAGGESWCDRSYARCAALGNIVNFGGSRWIPSFEGKQIWWAVDPKA